ncbi:type II secretion system protein F [Arthrobacter silviterrae]|uniref:Type II secretion system protein F n=2 Tax=Arthrobacter silviterrae TaxID=2026658 RepID=A0ABX0DD35_9MICC|nr:type II secretion system protein F [Arthrobacter silviterrae]
MLFGAVVLLFLAAAVVIFGVFKPGEGSLPVERRRPADATSESGLSRMTGSAAGIISAALQRLGWSRALAAGLERAGLKLAPAEFLILVFSGMLTVLLFGYLLSGIGLGLLLALLVPLGAKLLLGLKESKRRTAFANQLDDTLQLLSGGLRAGHSLLRAIDAVSHEAESPTNEEFARIVNETRLGRDLNEALEQSAERMHSDDFGWAAQAIGIHREVGGDLASVLDQVGHTIRERNQIRRQVAGLSAEGKMSAYILFAIPFAVIGILTLTSPSYIAKFIQSPIGFAMIGASIVMLTIGGLWMKKVVSFKF